MTTRFQDDGRTIWDFVDEILVTCPSCGGCAHVLPSGRDRGLFGARRVTCLACGYARDAASRRAAKARPLHEARRARAAPPGPVDTFLGLPLYLQTYCAGETLWALNARHLAWLEAFLAAPLREDAAPERRKTAVSALPQWLILARHRGEALRGVARLRAKLLA